MTKINYSYKLKYHDETITNTVSLFISDDEDKVTLKLGKSIKIDFYFDVSEFYFTDSGFQIETEKLFSRVIKIYHKKVLNQSITNLRIIPKRK